MMTRHDVVGASPAWLKALRRAEEAVGSDVPMLLTGESGTGKEVVSKLLHATGPRAKAPFMALNATAMPFHLLESELFGHERGAFTGADRARVGMFQEADRGTILIDEIGDLPLLLQAKLLRVLQEREIRPVGRSRPIPIDVRVICATHRDLRAMVARGEFREDLFYRIAVYVVELPPLRERPTDIPLLAEHFLRRHGSETARLSSAAASVLMKHSWPGNARELENACRHALVLCRGGEVLPEHLPTAVLEARGPARVALSLWEVRDDFEHDRILRALSAVAGNRTQAARRLGVSRQVLHDRLKKFGIGPGAGRPSKDAEARESSPPLALGDTSFDLTDL